MRPTNTSRFRASLARVALRLALVALLALVAVDSGASTADVEARRQASSAAPSYRAKTFPLRVPNLRSVLQSAPPQAEEEEEEGGGTPSKAAQTKVDVGEFAGYTWSLWLTAATRGSDVITSLQAYPLEATHTESSVAVRYTVNLHRWGAAKRRQGPRSNAKESGSVAVTGSDVIRVSPGLEGVLEGAEATGRLVSYDALEALGAFAPGDGLVDVTVIMEAWTSLEEAPNARSVRVYLQRVPPNNNAPTGAGAGAGAVRGGGYSAEELSRRRKLAGKSGTVEAQQALALAESPVPSWAPDTVAVLSLLETDRLRVVSQLMAMRLGKDVVPSAAAEWRRFAFGQVGPLGLVTYPHQDQDHDQDETLEEGLSDGGRRQDPLFLEGVNWSLKNHQTGDEADEEGFPRAEAAEATMILSDRGASRAFASPQASTTIDAQLPPADGQGGALPPLCDTVSGTDPGTRVGSLSLAHPPAKKKKKNSGGDGGGGGGLEVSIHMCRSESGGVSFVAYSSPLSVLDLSLRVTLLHRWDKLRHLEVQGSVTVPPWDDSWSAPMVMQVMHWELEPDAGFVRPGPEPGQGAGAGGAGNGKGEKGKRGKGRGGGGSGSSSSAGSLRLQVKAAILRPRRVALRLPYEAWNTKKEKDRSGGAEGATTKQTGKDKGWGKDKGKSGSGGGEYIAGVHADWYAQASSPAAHHWIEVQPWESVHESIVRQASALASVAAGRTVTPEEIVVASGGILLPGPTWSPTTTSLYSALLHGASDFSPEATFNSSATWRWGVSDRATVHVLPRPAVSDPHLSRQCAATVPPPSPTEAGAAAEGVHAGEDAYLSAYASQPNAEEDRLNCELRELLWYLQVYKMYGRFTRGDDYDKSREGDGGDEDEVEDGPDDLSWESMLAMIDNGIVGGGGASHLLRDHGFLGERGGSEGSEFDNEFSHFGSDFAGLPFGAGDILPSSSETATELLLIAAAGVYVTMTGWYCAGAMRRLKTSGHNGRSSLQSLHHRRVIGGGGGGGGGPKSGRGGNLGAPGGPPRGGSGGSGAGGVAGGGGVSVGVQVAVAAAFAPVQAAWFLIGIPCDALAYLGCCAAAAIGVLLRCATLVVGGGAGPNDAAAMAAVINGIGGGADNKNGAGSGKKAKGGGAKGGGSKSSSSGAVSGGGAKNGKASAAAAAAPAAAAALRKETEVRAMAPATVSEEDLLAQQAREEAELEAQRLHAETRMRERRQAEWLARQAAWEDELRKKGGKAAVAAAKAAGGGAPADAAAKSTARARDGSPAPPMAQQPAILPPTSMTSLPTPLHANGTTARRAAGVASDPPLPVLSSNPPPATTTTGAALPKPRPLPASLADSLRRRVTPAPILQAQQQQQPPLPPPRPPLPQPQPQLQSQPPLPHQPPPPRQRKAGGGIPPLPPQPPPVNQPKRASQSWGGPPPPRGSNGSAGSGTQQPPLPAGQPPHMSAFEGPPLSPTGSSHSSLALRSDSDMLGGDHTSIPWSDAGAEMHEQETLVASMLEGLTSPDGPELALASALTGGGGDWDDLETSSTTTSSSAKFQAPPSPRAADAAAKLPGPGGSSAAAFGGGMWGAAGGAGGLAGGSFSLWGANNGDANLSPTGDATRTSLVEQRHFFLPPSR